MQSGMSLVESVVAIGLSGIFIVMLSTMLAQTLQLMRTSQDELIAVNAAELLIENSKNIPISRLQSLSAEAQPINLIMNSPDSEPVPSVRSQPVQLDLQNANKLFGVVNASDGSLSLDNSWNKLRGNHFDGKATVKIQEMLDPSITMKAYEVTVSISFKGTNSNPSSSYPRSIIRKTVIFDKEGTLI